MPKYSYKARNEAGEFVRGVVEAVNTETAIDGLRKCGQTPVEVRESLFSKEVNFSSFSAREIGSKDMMLFYFLVSSMLSAGISILTSLNTFMNQVENGRFKEIIRHMIEDIRAGTSFSGALARHPHVFSTLFINMVKAGEASGKLEIILGNFAKLYESQIELRQKIKGILIYPTLLFVMGISIILFMVSFFIPQFVEIFKSLDVVLPLSTRILYNVGLLIRGFWYVGIIVVFVIWRLVKKYIDTDSGRLNFDRFKLELPVVGALLRKVAIARFARTLGTLLESDVPILKSMDLTKDVLENKVLEAAILGVHDAVEQGKSITIPLKASKEFPVDVIQLISAGEESGTLPIMLHKIADFYNMMVSQTSKNLTTLIEPIFLFFMGGMVGFIMLSALLPLFSIASHIGSN